MEPEATTIVRVKCLYRTEDSEAREANLYLYAVCDGWDWAI